MTNQFSHFLPIAIALGIVFALGVSVGWILRSHAIARGAVVVKWTEGEPASHWSNTINIPKNATQLKIEIGDSGTTSAGGAGLRSSDSATSGQNDGSGGPDQKLSIPKTPE